MSTVEAPTFDASALKAWLSTAIEFIAEVSGRLDRENLFPVKDGDTGANVLATLVSGAEAIKGGLAGADDGLVALADLTASALLIGAKGNSGVILSQIFRGFADGIDGGLANALASADKAAKLAVTRPADGTILTAMAAAVADLKPAMNDAEVATAAWSAARSAALGTAAKPPVPSALGTIDAGAHALERILAALAVTLDPALKPMGPLRTDATLPVIPQMRRPSDGDFEVMYLLRGASTADAMALREQLMLIGESVLVVGSADLWNVHIHTNDAGAAVEAGLAHGVPYRVQITSLVSPGEEVCEASRRVVAVANGVGIADVLQAAGATVITAFDSRRVTPDEWWQAALGADEVVLLPQDRHGLASAQEALAAIRSDGIRVAVLPTRSTVQALAALAVHDPLRPFDDDVVAMTSAAGHTHYATLAIAKNASGDCKTPYAVGDVLGIISGEVLVVGKDLLGVANEVVRRMLMAGVEILTLITGADATAELADDVAAAAKALAPKIEIVIHAGGQAWYPLLIGVE